MLGCCSFTYTPCCLGIVNTRQRNTRSDRFNGKAKDLHVHAINGEHNSSDNSDSKKKVVIFGHGWAGLGAAHHICNQVLSFHFFWNKACNDMVLNMCLWYFSYWDCVQGFDVTVLGDGYGFGDPDDVGIYGNTWHNFPSY